jgi:hypothetical protein
MPLVSGEVALKEFRRLWTATELLRELSRQNGRMLVNWPVGVGKSHAVDNLIEEAVSQNTYDCVLVLCPTRKVINERRWIMTPPRGIRIVNIEPRPAKRCGTLDARWRSFERNDLGALGRKELCGNCSKRSGCAWPTQYGLTMGGVRVVFATHAHLKRSPSFISQIQKWTRAERLLVLFDEADFVMTSFRNRIEDSALRQFVYVLQKANEETLGASGKKYLEVAQLLVNTKTPDLRCADWKLPAIQPDWATAVQEFGVEVCGPEFKFLGYLLNNFCISPQDSRERQSNGDILFALKPSVGCDFILFSATSSPALAEFRIGREFGKPFQDYAFLHPGTVWYNIATSIGTDGYFLKNSPQILDFFAQLVARRLQEGRRPILIVKKRFREKCAIEMQSLLSNIGLENVRVVFNRWRENDLRNPNVIPLIHYGMVGTNLFEHFDCAFCLSSYYVNESVLNGVVQDVLGSDYHIPIQIKTGGRPRRRTVSLVNSRDKFFDVIQLAKAALEDKELGTVIQAIGRVRPFTKPREILTMQCSVLSSNHPITEFQSLDDARQHFQILSPQKRRIDLLIGTIKKLRNEGKTQKQAGDETNVSLRTVKRYWNIKRCQNTFI